MKKVPYHSNPGNACALACYTMVAKYMFPKDNITFEQVGKISNWHKGYVVWGFSFWKWLMDKGAKITNYDVIDIEAWVEQGLEGLRISIPEKEFNFYKDSTYDIENQSKNIKDAYMHPNFTYIRKKVTWEDVLREFNKPGICDLTVDGRKLHKKEGFTVHRVVLLDITNDIVIFHDPIEDNSGAYTKESIDHFRPAMDSLDGVELTRYSL